MNKKDELLLKAVLSRISEEDMDKLYKELFEKRVFKTIKKYEQFKEQKKDNE